jgi:hypothetical protein
MGDCGSSQFRALINLRKQGVPSFFLRGRRGRKTFCQSTVMSIGKFSLKSETSPGGEQHMRRLYTEPMNLLITLISRKLINLNLEM